jgi:hypothetical protein
MIIPIKKIDVENMEIIVLEGTINLISEYKHNIMNYFQVIFL